MEIAGFWKVLLNYKQHHGTLIMEYLKQEYGTDGS